MIINLSNGLTYNTDLPFHAQNSDTQSFLYSWMQTILPLVYSEQVDENNDRPLTEVFEDEYMRLTINYEYNFQLPSKEWRGINNQFYGLELI